MCMQTEIKPQIKFMWGGGGVCLLCHLEAFFNVLIYPVRHLQLKLFQIQLCYWLFGCTVVLHYVTNYYFMLCFSVLRSYIYRPYLLTMLHDRKSAKYCSSDGVRWARCEMCTQLYLWHVKGRRDRLEDVVWDWTVMLIWITIFIMKLEVP